MANEYVSNINGYTLYDEEAHERLTALGAEDGDTMDKQYIKKINGYYVKDEAARNRIATLEAGGDSVATCTVVIDMSAISAHGTTYASEIFYTQLQDGIWPNYEIIPNETETLTLTDVVCGSGLTIRLKVGAYNNDTNGTISNSYNCLFFIPIAVGAGETQTIYFEADD